VSISTAQLIASGTSESRLLQEKRTVNEEERVEPAAALLGLMTDADAAGLAILPGLVRYDQVYDPTITEIRHAFRVTVRASNGYVYPASHRLLPPIFREVRLFSNQVRRREETSGVNLLS